MWPQFVVRLAVTYNEPLLCSSDPVHLSPIIILRDVIDNEGLNPLVIEYEGPDLARYDNSFHADRG